MYKPQPQLQSDVNNKFLSRPNEGLMFGSDGQTYSGGATGGAGTYGTPREEAAYWDNDNMYQGMLKQMQSLPVGSQEREALRIRMEQYRTNKFASAMPVSQAGILPSTKATTPAATPPPTPPAPATTTPTPPAAAATPPATPPTTGSNGQVGSFGTKASPTNIPPQSGSQTSTPNTPNTPNQPPANANNGLWTSLQEAQKLLMEHQQLKRPDHTGPYNHFQGQTDDWNKVNRDLRARIDYLNKKIKEVHNTEDKAAVKQRNARQAEEAKTKETAKQAADAEAQTKAQAVQDKVHGQTVENTRVDTEKNDVMKKAGAMLADGDITQQEFDLLTQNPARAAPTIARMWAQKYKLNASGQDPNGDTPGATPDENYATKTWNKLETPQAPPVPAAPPVASVEPPPAPYSQQNSGRYDRYKQGKPFDPSTIPYDQNTTPGAHPNYSAYG